MRFRSTPKADQITRAAARTQLRMLLSGAKSLDGFTVDLLARTHRLPIREIEYELQIARQKRGVASL